MNNPELRSPQEWAEELREDATNIESLGGVIQTRRAKVKRELADRMDDLTEALRLLREMTCYDDTIVNAPDADWRLLNERDALLAKYAKED